MTILLKDKDDDDVIDRTIEIVFDDNDMITSATADIIENSLTDILVVEEIQIYPQKVTIWFSGGLTGTTYEIDFFVNTRKGRRINDTLQLKVVNN